MEIYSWFLFTGFILQLVSAEIILQHNKYEGVIVAIGSHVKEDYTLVEDVKVMFEEGSAYLYNATRKRATFGEVTIVVPSSWKYRSDYQVAEGRNWMESAHFRIDNPHPLYGDVPYTVQPGNCGEPGLYVHFTPNFIKLNNGSRFGSRGKVLVHEWAHLRYGVFDEYGDGKQFPMTYLSQGAEVRFNGCPKDIKGWILNPDGSQCTRDAQGNPSSRCRFYPDASATVPASLMSASFLDGAVGFCDDNTSSANNKSTYVQHNSDAPNLHNQKCKRQSTWTIVASHTDFKDNNNPPKEITDLRPKFTVIQPRSGVSVPYIISIDSSKSMLDLRTDYMKQALIRLIEIIPEGTPVGLMKFSSNVEVLHEITKVQWETKSVMKAKIEQALVSENGTALGKSLEQAIQVLDRSNYTAGNVILLTDGKETGKDTKSRVEETIPLLQQHNVTVYPVFFSGSGRDFNTTHFKKMENLAKKTGGIIHSGKVKRKSNIDVIFFDILSRNTDSESAPNRIHTGNGRVNASSPLVKEIYLDHYTAEAVSFMFHFNRSANSSQPDVILTTPSRQTYAFSQNTSLFQHFNDSGSILFKSAHREAGVWAYSVLAPNDTTESINVAVNVVSVPADNQTSSELKIRTWTPVTNIEKPAAARILTSVFWHYSPVINASVQVKIERPNGTICIDLKDDGVGADNFANDGVYSVDFAEFSSVGIYSLESLVKSTEYTYYLEAVPDTPAGSKVMERSWLPKSANLSEARSSFDVMSLPVSNEGPVPKAAYREVKMEYFERTSPAASFQLETYDPSKDEIPPSAINDLKLSIDWQVSSSERLLANLDWTSAGDDAGHGRAQAIQLRYSWDSSFQSDFLQGNLIESRHVKMGDLTPKHGGHKHYLAVEVPLLRTVYTHHGTLLYFAVITIDDWGNAADPSNYAMVYVPAELPEPGLTAGTISLLAVLILVAIITVAVLVLRYLNYKTQKHMYSKSNSPGNSLAHQNLQHFPLNMYSSGTSPAFYATLPTQSQDNITRF